MNRSRIFADFYKADEKGRLRLNCIGTIENLAPQQAELENGQQLTLYSEDLEVDGVVQFSEDEKVWVATIDWLEPERIVPVLFLQGKRQNMNNEPTSSNSQTDWQRLDAMSDEDIDLSDCPEITPEMFAKAVVRKGLPVTEAKAQVTLRIDSDVLEWFKSQGQGYQTQINRLLRAYMEAHE
jgi:uncharacterized protein (DUF4415 family)